MFSPAIETEILLPNNFSNRQAFIAETEARLTALAEAHNDLARATVTLRSAEDGAGLLSVKIVGSVGAAQLQATGEGMTGLIALEQALFAFQEKLIEYRDILPGDIEDPITDSVPQEVLELTVNTEGEMVPEVDEALRREQVEHYDNMAERLAHEDEMPADTY